MKKLSLWIVTLIAIVILFGCQQMDKPLSIWVTDDELWTFVGEKVTLSPIIEFESEGLVYDHPFIYTSSNYQVIRFLEHEKNVFEVLSFSDTPIIITIYDASQTLSVTIKVNVVRQVQGIRNITFGNVQATDFIIGQNYPILIDVIGLSEGVQTLEDDILYLFNIDVYTYNTTNLTLEPLDDILAFENDRVYVLGYAKGMMRYSLKTHPHIYYDVFFETAFKTLDVYQAVSAVVDISAGFITGTTLSTIEALTIYDEFGHMPDYMVSPNIKRITIGYTNRIASITGLDSLSEIIVLVPITLYNLYMLDSRYQTIQDMIYPNMGQSLSEVVYEFKNTFTSEKEFIVLTKGLEKTMTEERHQLGYTFIGWKTDEQSDILATHTVSSYLKLSSVWNINTYRITFDTMDGIGIAYQDYVYNQNLNLPLEAPDIYRDTHVFKGWYVDSQYQTPFTLTKMPANSITLYAKWGLLVKLTFVTNGGPSISAIEQEVGTPFDMPSYGTYSGHVFGGWFIDPEFSTPFTAQVMPSSDRTIYLKWDATYTIYFYDAGNKTSMPVIFDKDIDLGIPTKQNATFDGWTVYMNGQFYAISQVFKYTYQTDIHVYAEWLFDVTYVTNNPAVPNYVLTHRSRDSYQFTNMTNSRPLGYQFDAWYFGSNPLGSAITLTHHHMVEARWLRIHLLATGSGSLQNPYKIEHVDQWRDLYETVNNGNNLSGKHVVLIRDLDFVNQTIIPVGNNNNAEWFNNQTAYQFMGTFDGKSYSMSNFLIDVVSSGDTFAGLFGYIGSLGTVKNLNVSNPNVTGSSSMPYVAGENKGGTHHGAIAGINSGLIQSVSITGGLITGSALLDTHHGGVAGYIYQSTGRIIDVVVNTIVSGTARRYASHGGIVGSLNNGYLSTVTFRGAVRSTFLAYSSLPSSVIRYSFLGGIAGVSAGIIINASLSSTTTLSDTTTSTSVTPFEHFHGGIVGYMHDGSNQTASNQNSKNNLVIETYNNRGYNILTTTYEVALINVDSRSAVFTTPSRGSYFSGGITGTIQHTHKSSGMRMAISGYQMSHANYTGTFFGDALEHFNAIGPSSLSSSIGPSNELILRFSFVEEDITNIDEQTSQSITSVIFSILMLMHLVYITVKRRNPYV